MNTLELKKLTLSLLVAGGSLGLSAHVGAVALVLDPLVTGSAPSGGSAGGLTGNWYKLQNDAYFSTYVYTDSVGTTDQIKNFGWGTGIWAATDIPAIVAGTNPYVTRTATSVGAVSYANNIYNNTVDSGSYGLWDVDYTRTLAPIVTPPNDCTVATQNDAACAGEQNYAAVFTGYLYVATAGTYDFGVFADDGFNFSLTGSNGSASMEHNTVAGSSGRGQYSLLDQNHLDSLTLDVGYYAIDLSYFNRLEAGVIDLVWAGPGASTYTVIDPGNLYNVPEPTTLALMGLALLGLWRAGKRRNAGTVTLRA